MDQDPELKKALESIVLFKVDGEKGEGIDLAKTHVVRGYPTFELLNAEGETIDRWVGYAKGMFLTSLAVAQQDLTPLEAKRARFASAPTARDAAALGRYHASRSELTDAVHFFREAERLNQDATKDYAGDIFQIVSRGLPDTTFTLADLTGAADAVLACRQRTPLLLVEVASTTLRLARDFADPTLAVPYVQVALDETAASTDPQVQQFRKELLADQALYIQRDPERALTLKREAMPAGWMENPSNLNDFTWWCFEGRVNLAEAEELARKGVALATSDKEKAMILDTLAEIVYARGNPTEAVTLLRQAVGLAPDSQYYVRQLERFRRLAAGS